VTVAVTVQRGDTSRGASQPVTWSGAGWRLVGPLAVCLIGCSVYDSKEIEPNFRGSTAGSAGSTPVMPGVDSGPSPTIDGGPVSGSGGSAGAGSGGSCAAGSGGCQDMCPMDPLKTAPGACGCGESEDDGDDDGTPDCIDDCPTDPDKKTPGECGCGAPDADTDMDGSSDCADRCPMDAAKTEPGECGCGMLDSQDDGDGDGAVDCVDECPMDMLKTEAGMCGCGMAETGDGDTDGTPDCMDMCPADPGKTAPGGCGCGIPDEDSGPVIGCLGLKNTLVRRYRFEGTGSSVVDAKGGAPGTLQGGATLMSGGALLSGTNQYVELPDTIVSGLTDATIEMWVTWTGTGGDWQRLFDFGSSSSGSGTSYLFLTPRAPSPAVMRLTYRASGGSAETRVDSTRSLPTNVLAHVAVVFDDTNNRLAFYLNTTLEGMAMPFNGRLADVDDVNDWLGRSQFSTDPELAGTIHELRIYNKALTQAQLNFSLTQGQEPSFLPVE
jgi:hypothetical protein